MKKVLMTSLILLSLLFGVLPAQEKASDIAKEIYQQNLIRFSCRLTEREAEDAARHFLRLEGVTVKSFSTAAESMKILVKGLRSVVEQHQDPDAVYKSLQMQKYNIQPGNWVYYLKKYRTPESISKLEKWIPDNEQVIIRSTAKSIKPMLERWLLKQKILLDFSRRYPEQKNLPDDRKIRLWWEQELKKQTAIRDDQLKGNLLEILSRPSIPLNHADFWKKYFEARLKEQ